MFYCGGTMKYLILVYDGMADYKVPSLGDLTPMEAADKPYLDSLARRGIVGTVCNIPSGMVPESDTANLAILSYDPLVYSKGRSPLEAMSMGLSMRADETAFRCNLVTLTEDEPYDDKIILDHSADEISTSEAAELIEAIEQAFGNESRHFYPGVSYRHCLLWRDIADNYPFNRPHDILGRRIGEYLPSGKEGEPYYRLMKESYEILNDHPVNRKRRERGLRPANSLWLWSPGKKPALPSFYEKWGVKASVISAVDLIKGIGLCAEMEVLQVEGATGNYKTNYDGKAAAAIDAYQRGQECVYIHVEAPDECGHRAEVENKVACIGLIDQKILRPICEYLQSTDEPYRVMVLPDHPTPVSLRTHTAEPVPYMIYESDKAHFGVSPFTEETAAACRRFLPDGTQLLEMFFGKKPQSKE